MWLIKVNRGKRLRWITCYAHHVIDSMIVLHCSTSSMHTTSTQCTTAATTLFQNQPSQKLWKIWEASNILERPHLFTRKRAREREREILYYFKQLEQKMCKLMWQKPWCYPWEVGHMGLTHTHGRVDWVSHSWPYELGFTLPWPYGLGLTLMAIWVWF